MRVAVSLCNAADREGRVLGVLDTATLDWTPIDYGRIDVTSACGVAADANYLYSACNAAGVSHLAVFDRRALSLVDVIPLPTVRDVHSIALDGDAIIAVSTGTDEVVRIPSGGRGEPETLWRASGTNSDTHHLNSVAWFGANLLCSGFGPKSAERWSSARDGYVYDISEGVYRSRGLYHPHSLTAFGQKLYVCESSLGVLRDLKHVVARFPGYLRGLAFAPDGTYVVGTSVGRSDGCPGVVLNPADPGEPHGRCAAFVSAQSKASGDSVEVDLSTYGNEIYDLLVLDAR